MGKKRKYSGGQPLLQPSRMDNVGRDFFQLGRLVGNIAAQKQQLQQEQQQTMLQKLMLQTQQMKLQEILGQINSRTAVLQDRVDAMQNGPLSAGPPGLTPELPMSMMQGGQIPPAPGMPMGGGSPIPTAPPGMPPEMAAGPVPSPTTFGMPPVR